LEEEKFLIFFIYTSKHQLPARKILFLPQGKYYFYHKGNIIFTTREILFLPQGKYYFYHKGNIIFTTREILFLPQGKFT
jgi:hypothetical protein